ncbi:MAG: class I SAM-dependent methyltransferase [archaeon]|nr:class I SAM-dependent methyltransferase [archaeon]
MGNLLNIITPLHQQTKRDYLNRMVDEKVFCMKTARQYGSEFWDGDRRFGYGGYRYDGRWKPVARKLIETFNLPLDAKILDVGCGKGYLLYEIKRLLPGSYVCGFDLSHYAIENAKEEIQKNLFFQNAQDSYPFDDNAFDLVLSLTTLHNLQIHELKSSLKEIQRVGRNKYITVESYRNEDELFNLQCWALTCESYHRPLEWTWLFEEFGYTGDYEFIYFE